MDYGGDSGGHRGRREAFENIRRNDAAAWRERLEAEAVRTRLEKRAPGGQRANLGRIVAMAAVDSVANRSLEGTLGALRRMAQGKMRKAAAERPKVQSEAMPATKSMCPSFGRLESAMRMARSARMPGRLAIISPRAMAGRSRSRANGKPCPLNRCARSLKPGSWVGTSNKGVSGRAASWR